MNTNAVIDHYYAYATGNPITGGLLLLTVAIVVIIGAVALFKLLKKK
jgi:hypothetical protein